MSHTIDAQIQEKEDELNPIVSRMDALRLQFINDTTQFAAKWFEETLKEYATKYPEIILRLSREKLSSMKAQLAVLVKNAGTPVNEALSIPGVWWHLKPVINDDCSQYEQLGNDNVGNRFPEKIDYAVRLALGELGVILEKYGFNVTTDPAKKSVYPEFWFSRPENGEKAAHPYYPHLLKWSEEMKDTMQKYNSLFKRAIVLFSELQNFKNEKRRREASELWESV